MTERNQHSDNLKEMVLSLDKRISAREDFSPEDLVAIGMESRTDQLTFVLSRDFRKLSVELAGALDANPELIELDPDSHDDIELLSRRINLPEERLQEAVRALGDRQFIKESVDCGLSNLGITMGIGLIQASRKT